MKPSILFFDLANVDPMKSGISRVTYTLATYFQEKVCPNNVHFAYFYDTGFRDSSSNPVFISHQLPNNKKCDSKENRDKLYEIVNKYDINIIINQTLPEIEVVKLCRNVCAKTEKTRLISVIHNTPFFFIDKQRNINKSPFREISFGKPLLRWLLGDFYLLLLKELFKYKYRIACRLSDTIATLSESYNAEFVSFLGAKSIPKIIAISNPINQSYLEIEPISFKERKKQIIFVGRLSKIKGVDRLIQIWDKIHQKIPGWSLAIVGDGEEKGKLEVMAANLKLDTISFLGFQDPSHYMNTSSILCLPSEYEGLPLVLTEAMLLGTIPVCFNSFAAAKDLIDSGVNGFLVEPFDLDAFAEKLLQLCNDDLYRENMSKEAKIKAQAFTPERIGKEWENLFQRLLID